MTPEGSTSLSSGSPIVDAIGRMHFEGNIIPTSWYQNIRLNRHADLVAITILGDIVYWYRPTEVRDEQTGALIGYRKKFEKDWLRRAYGDWGILGLSKEQARDGCHRLRDMGLIQIDRRIEHWQGMTINNVIYLAPVPERIADITYRLLRQGLSTSKCTPLASKVPTNPETTAETSQRDSLPCANAPVASVERKHGIAADAAPKPGSTEPPISPEEEQVKALALALAEVCEYDYANNENKLLHEAHMLLRSKTPPTPELLTSLYGEGGAWYEHDWRGKKGESPTPELIRETWRKLKRQVENPRAVKAPRGRRGGGAHVAPPEEKDYLGGPYAKFFHKPSVPGEADAQ